MNSDGGVISKQEVERMLRRQREAYEARLREMAELNIGDIRNESRSTERSSSSHGHPRGCTPSHYYSSFGGEHSGRRPQSRARPQPKPKHRNTVETRDEFNCPTCKKPYGSRIYQCGQGHSSCAECKIRGTPCGLCKENITDVRNITLESYLSEFQGEIQCPNSGDGCRLRFKMMEMEYHLKECLFSDILCPFNDIKHCAWIGKAMELDKHFKNTHAENIVDHNINSEINIALDSYQINLMNLPPFKFLFFINGNIPDKICMAVQMIGTTVSARKWCYEIVIYDNKESKRMLKYSDICVSHSTSVEEIFLRKRGLVMERSVAMSYADEGRLKYKLFFQLQK